MNGELALNAKYVAYPKYRKAEVEFLDELPFDWCALKGKFVFSEYGVRSTTGTETLLSVSEYYGVKPCGEVIANGDFLSRAESLVGYKKCEKNDLVMNIMLAWKRGLGVTKYDGIVSPAYSVFRFNESANPDYMHYLLRTDIYIDHFKTRSTGVIDSRLRLYPESFANVPIILPPVEQQQKIANFLDHETAKIDTLIEKQQQLIALLKEKRQAVISHAVTKGLNPDVPMRDSGVEWLGEVPEHWVVMPLKYSVTFQRGHDLPAQHRIAGDVPLVTSAGISSSHNIAVAKAPGLVTGRYGTIGKFNLLEKDYWPLNTTLYSINLRGNKPKYLWYMLHNLQPIFIANSLKSAVPGVDRNDLHTVKVAVTKDHDEQDALCDYLDNINKKYDEVTKKAIVQIELLQERRTALISAAVTGKIDVRNWQAD